MPPTNKDPKCCRCRNHNVISKLKGHKHFCRWKDCSCQKCILLSRRQQISREQIRIRRQQDLDQERIGSVLLPVQTPENPDDTETAKYMNTQMAPPPISVHSWSTGEQNIKGIVSPTVQNGSFSGMPVHRHDGTHFFPPAAAYPPAFPAFSAMSRYQAAPYGGHNPYSQFGYTFRSSSPYCVPYHHNTNYAFPPFNSPMPNNLRHPQECSPEDGENLSQSGSYTLLRPTEHNNSINSDITQETDID